MAESILPVLNLANAQGQEKAGLETDKYYGVQDVYKRQAFRLYRRKGLS